MKINTKRMPTNFPIGTKVRDIYTGKVSTVKGLEWQSYTGGDTSDYTVEFAEGGWNKSTNLEKVTWPEPTQTEQRDTATQPQKRVMTYAELNKAFSQIDSELDQCKWLLGEADEMANLNAKQRDQYKAHAERLAEALKALLAMNHGLDGTPEVRASRKALAQWEGAQK